MIRSFRQAFLAIVISGACTAATIFILAIFLFRDFGVSSGTALTYLVPGVFQSALCLLLYRRMTEKAAQDGLTCSSSG